MVPLEQLHGKALHKAGAICKNTIISSPQSRLDIVPSSAQCRLYYFAFPEAITALEEKLPISGSFDTYLLTGEDTSRVTRESKHRYLLEVPEFDASLTFKNIGRNQWALQSDRPIIDVYLPEVIREVFYTFESLKKLSPEMLSIVQKSLTESDDGSGGERIESLPEPKRQSYRSFVHELISWADPKTGIVIDNEAKARNPTPFRRDDLGYTIYTHTGRKNTISIAYNPEVGNACYITWSPDRKILTKTKAELRKLTDIVARVTRQESRDERMGLEDTIRWQNEIRSFMERTD